MGEEVPDGAMDLDLSEYVGRTFSVTVVNEEYQGKMRPKVAAYGGEGEPQAASQTKGGKDKETPAETSPARRRPARRAAKDGFNDGDKVKFKDQGKLYKGEVVSIEGDTATVSVDDEEWEIAVEDLEAV
jgi:hypothetical protein